MNPSGSPDLCDLGWRSYPCPNPYRGRHVSCFRSPFWGREDWRDYELPLFPRLTPVKQLMLFADSHVICPDGRSAVAPVMRISLRNERDGELLRPCHGWMACLRARRSG